MIIRNFVWQNVGDGNCSTESFLLTILYPSNLLKVKESLGELEIAWKHSPYGLCSDLALGISYAFLLSEAILDGANHAPF